MRGGGALGFAPNLDDDSALPRGATLLAEGDTSTCCVCAGRAHVRAGRVQDIYGNGFTDWGQLAHHEPTICCSCLRALKTNREAVKKGASGRSVTSAPPSDCPGWVLSGGEVTDIEGGLAGLEALAGLSERHEAFSVIVGSWPQQKHYWIQAPKAYGSATWPALFIGKSGPEIAWMRKSYLLELCERTRAALDAGASMSSLTAYKYPSQRLKLKPEVEAVTALIYPKAQYGAASPAHAAVARRVLNRSAPSQKKKPKTKGRNKQ